MGFPLGILNKIEIPRFIKGFVKSITASLAKFMVKAPMAISAVPSINSVKMTAVKLTIPNTNKLRQSLKTITKL